MDNGRLQEIKKGPWMLQGSEEWTNQDDADTEAVILELIAAYETSQQQLAEAEKNIVHWENYVEYMTGDRNNYRERWREAEAENRWTVKYREAIIEDKAMARKLAASQAEVERLEVLYNSDRANYLNDITLLQKEKNNLLVETERLRAQVTIAQAENTAIEEFIAEHGTIR